MSGNPLPTVLCDVDAEEPLRATWPEMDERIHLEPLGASSDLANADMVITRHHPLGEADLVAAKRLRWVSAWGVGYDHIDVIAAARLGVPVSCNPVFTTSMAEAALTLILALTKRLPQLTAAARGGESERDVDGGPLRNLEMEGKTLGVIGFGRIGKRIGELGRCLGMRIGAFDPMLTEAEDWYRLQTVESLLSASDVVVLAAPLTNSTYHLIDARRLGVMKPGAYLVNIGRGGLVDEHALYDALISGRLAGAGLDVWEHEPVDPSHRLLALPNVVGTGHSLGRTRESLQRICESLVSNIRAVISGEPIANVVNRDVLRTP